MAGVFRSFNQVFASHAERRPYQYPEPWKFCVPLLVTTCIWPPTARPYSAWYEFVRILNSATESMLVVTMLPPLLPVSMLATPSIVMLLDSGRWPFTVKPSTDPISVPAAPPDSTPGTRVAKLNSIRPLLAMFSSAWLSSVNDRSPLFDCSEV